MKNCLHNTKRILPFLGFSVIAGLISALWGTAFKLGAEWVIHLSSAAYGAVQQAPIWIPLLLIGAAVLGLGASILVSHAQSCKGGGIPTAVAAVRGIVDFPWLQSALILPFSALITFLSGLPLGTEGPCVQMGTAIGDGVTQCLGGKKHRVWRRYIMTGGAAAGFSIATASPITAIVFSLEELHKKFSPLLLAGVSVAVMTAQIAAQLLAAFGIGSTHLFHALEIGPLPASKVLVPVLIGIVCGLCSVLFTTLYHKVEAVVRKILGKLSIKVLFPILFAGICLIGLCLSDALSTGHSLVDKLFHPGTAWYLLILVFLLRAVFMMVANTAGVTGGAFLPTLAFGAIVGALCAEAMVALGMLEQQQYLLAVVLGVTAFLGATSRIPITACVFAVEALSGFSNTLPIVIAATVAYLIAELSGVEDFTDAVIEAKERSLHKDKKPETFDYTLTVGKDSFLDGRKLCDILRPNACAVISVEHAHAGHHGEHLQAEDKVTLRYQTYDPAATAEELNALAGEQSPINT